MPLPGLKGKGRKWCYQSPVKPGAVENKGPNTLPRADGVGKKDLIASLLPS